MHLMLTKHCFAHPLSSYTLWICAQTQVESVVQMFQANIPFSQVGIGNVGKVDAARADAKVAFKGFKGWTGWGGSMCLVDPGMRCT